jgi:hypothetical protein
MSYKVTIPLTTEQFAANERHFKTYIDLNIIYIWEDTGNVYKCGEGTIKPQTTKGFYQLVDVVSKDFARQYVSPPDIVEIESKGGKAVIPGEDCDKEKMLEQVWSYSQNHKIADMREEKPEKVKKGKKGRGKK